ncbi:MAG: class I SAM-dependent methyltransferase [Candidatus Methanosuratincola petrocarbonis]
MWKFYSIREKRHVYCNPLNRERFEAFLKQLQLEPNSTVLDIACGKGEFLVKLSELYRIKGVGVDISPYFIQEARKKARLRVPDAPLDFIEIDGKNYKPQDGKLFDLSSCIGATWIWNGYKGTLKALKDMTKPGGLLLVGEPFWLKEPDPEYLRAESLQKEEYAGSHQDNVRLGEACGLSCIYALASTKEDFDHYEMLGWWSLEDYVRQNSNDPDIQEILALYRKGKENYLRWGRETMGWATYLFRKP